MTKKLLSRVGVIAVTGVLAAALAACSSGGGTPSPTSSTGQKGGTLTSLDVAGEYEATDPV